jgi:hypothetical protein
MVYLNVPTMQVKIISAKQLRDTILFLEEKKRQQEQALHEQLENTYESLKSINLIKSTLHSVLGIDEHAALLPSLAGTLGSVVIKKIMPGNSGNIVKRILGAGIGLTLGKWISKKINK